MFQEKFEQLVDSIYTRIKAPVFKTPIQRYVQRGSLFSQASLIQRFPRYLQAMHENDGSRIVWNPTAGGKNGVRAPAKHQPVRKTDPLSDLTVAPRRPTFQ